MPQTKILWPARRALLGDSRLHAVRMQCEAFPEYAPLLEPFAPEV
jgi:hypothetical protein